MFTILRFLDYYLACWKIGISVKFINEHIRLTLKERHQHSTDLLIWACKLFYSYPTANHCFRNSKRLILPHPSYLQKLLQNMGNLEAVLSASTVQYIKEKIKHLEDHKKITSIMLDKIYVRPDAEYSGRKIIARQ